jgi:hypothetical protein
MDAHASLPADLQDKMQGLQDRLDQIRAALEPLLALDQRQVAAGAPPLHRARLHLTLAQSAAALFRLYLTAANVPPATHPVAKEAERLAQFERRVAGAEGAQEKRGKSLHIAAANRFIAHAIPDLTGEQRAALKAAAQREQEEFEKKGKAGGGKKRGADSEAEALLQDILGDTPAAAAAGAASAAAAGTPGTASKRAKKAGDKK